jgi:predicted GIY-YIG superfamily endonuclease
MPERLKDAFDAAANGFSADRVVADPLLNERFVAECLSRDLNGPVAELNRSLLNLRKAGGLAGRPRSKQTHFKNQDEYRFAAEMAIRFLERRDQLSLDSIICDPDRASEFDKIAARIAPGHTPLQYRWAAFSIRKTGNLEPEVAARILPPTQVINLQVDQINANELSTEQALYLFFDASELLYVGETENLKSRIKKHLDHSDNKGLARWMWEFGTKDLNLEIQTLATSTTSRARKALELELIRSRQPVFNVKR